MSSPPLRVFLTKNQEQSLFKLSRSQQVPQRTRDRADALRLSSMGWKVEKIAVYLKCTKQTVRNTIHRWKNRGIVGLWDAHRQGYNDSIFIKVPLYDNLLARDVFIFIKEPFSL